MWKPKGTNHVMISTILTPQHTFTRTDNLKSHMKWDIHPDSNITSPPNSHRDKDPGIRL